MNRRSIIKQLSRKHKEFLDSIEDPAIRKRINEDAIISGGCIASMLLREKVNDYDYYFTNKRTTLAVAEYFCEQFIKNSQEKESILSEFTNPKVYVEKNGERVDSTEDFDRVRIMIKSAGIVGEESDAEDYRYFESFPEDMGSEYIDEATEPIGRLVAQADKIDSEQLEEPRKYRPVYISDNAITLSGKIQLVIRFFGQPKELHQNFDYIHCTNYYVPKAHKLVLAKGAMESLLARELKYVGSLYPVCSVIRLRKFLGNGWHINAGQLLKICLQLSELNLKDLSVLEDQLTGVDTAYFQNMIYVLKQKQDEDADFIPDMPYVVSLIDKIFGQ